jgi:serine/threonine protein kinase
VKPQNILLARDGRARLTDFGSARMDGEATITRTGAIVGTLAYMAPETVAGRRGDARADVFALGMTLFHAAAGRLPDRPSPHLPLPSSLPHARRARRRAREPRRAGRRRARRDAA